MTITVHIFVGVKLTDYHLQYKVIIRSSTYSDMSQSRTSCNQSVVAASVHSLLPKASPQLRLSIEASNDAIRETSDVNVVQSSILCITQDTTPRLCLYNSMYIKLSPMFHLLKFYDIVFDLVFSKTTSTSSTKYEIAFLLPILNCF